MLHRLFITAVILLVGFTFSIFAQKPSRQNEMGIVPGMPFASSDIENVNLTNGNLNFSFPLGNLPAGRGQAAAGMFLKYNSKLWKKHVETIANSNGVMTKQYFLSPNDESGWQIGEKYNLRVINRNDGLAEPLQVCNPDNSTNLDAVYLWKVQLDLPDGGKREFRPLNHSVPSTVTGNFYNIHPNGSGVSGGCAGVTQTQDPNPSRTYYSVDGSYMRLIVYNNLDWELYLTDGSKVTQNTSTGLRIYDRNGNYVQWGTVTLPNGQAANGWIDQFQIYGQKIQLSGARYYLSIGIQRAVIGNQSKLENGHGFTPLSHRMCG